MTAVDSCQKHAGMVEYERAGMTDPEAGGNAVTYNPCGQLCDLLNQRIHIENR